MNPDDILEQNLALLFDNGKASSVGMAISMSHDNLSHPLTSTGETRLAGLLVVPPVETVSPKATDNGDTLSDSNDSDIPSDALLLSVNYDIRIKEIKDLESFATVIKDTVVNLITPLERFSGVRLSNTTLRYDDWLCTKYRGFTHNDDTIQVKQTESAIQLAGTVVHELAHVLVGTKEQHSPTWIEACKILGLTHRELTQHYVPDDFSPILRQAIALAIIQFTKENPWLVGDNVVVWPDGLQPIPFQIDCVKVMLGSNQNWLVADEMGLGKTIESLLYINSLQRRLDLINKQRGIDHPDYHKHLRVLTICPNSLRLNWLNECNKWLEPRRNDIEMTTTTLYLPSDFIVASYEGAKKWNRTLGLTKWDVLIVDEAHYCKNPSAQRSRAVFNLKARYKLFMTGTPIVNYPYELFPLLHSLDPEVWREAAGFQGRYCTVNKYGRNLQELHDRLRYGKVHSKRWDSATRKYADTEQLIFDHAPIMIRRLKKDVLTQLPKKRRQIIEVPCDSNPELKRLIEYEKKLWDSADGKEISDEILAALNLTREAGTSEEDLALIIETLGHSRQFLFEEMSRIRHQTALAKCPLLIEHIQECLDSFEDGEKLVIFIHHNDVASKIYEHFHNNIGTVLVTGLSTPVHERQACVDKFQTDPRCRLFIGSMRVSGLGITLTAAHHIIFGELDWTPALLTQCEDRCHRIGQEYPLLIQHFVVEKSMDSFMAKKIVNKQRSIKMALDSKK